MSRALAVLLILGLGGPVLACINDNESPSHEREFRSQYLLVDQPPSASRSGPINHDALSIAGVVLLMAAFADAAFRRTGTSRPCPNESDDWS